MEQDITEIRIVENGTCTSYIDSLLVGLFYTPSCIYNKLLEDDPSDIKYMYLQDIIKYHFIDQLRKSKSVSANTMNYIRNYIFFNTNWLSNNVILKEQNIAELYTHLMKNTSNQYIEIKKTDTLSSTEIIPYIKLEINGQTETSIKELLYNWLNEKTKSINPTIYRINNIPNIVPIYINRFNNNIKNQSSVDIKEKIRLYNENDELGKVKWSIHSVICHVGDNIETGHYYTILVNANRWLMFDNMSVPSICEINMSNTSIINKIKRECVMLIYKFD